ncbi:MAG: hypothetical protein DWQ31_03395 [Planctomycetota bacterium]|nr:MAG: hypothetical protein DWQ31_18385 [Planctomycetota bacterium]REJ69838.1 MAG: hypothetical protein DWQ31_03395 [Planctomycetota bacterium]REJ95168.1 MAG: hypothetical protein DWQ35_06895 [Planctomycetota bacterium]
MPLAEVLRAVMPTAEQPLAAVPIAEVPVEDWVGELADLGPVYPWLGSEIWMFAACLAFCVWFMIWKFVTEHRKYDSTAREMGDGDRLADALAIHEPEDITQRKRPRGDASPGGGDLG